jgi:pimeloyl-ACP methyl ester carboxylesterase
LLWGREDQVVPLSAAAEYQRVMKSARLSVFDSCGHRPEVEKPVEFLREVEGFLG